MRMFGPAIRPESKRRELSDGPSGSHSPATRRPTQPAIKRIPWHQPIRPSISLGTNTLALTPSADRIPARAA